MSTTELGVYAAPVSDPAPALTPDLAPAPAPAPSADHGSVPGGNLVELFERAARTHGWLGRMAYFADGLPYTFEQVYLGAARASTALAAAGAGPGSRVLIVLPDGIDLVWTFLGALRIGAVAVPVNVSLHPDELRRAAEIAQPHLVVCAPDAEPGFPAFSVLTPDALRSTGDGDEAPDYAACDDETPAFAVFTSGTTGDPRLCVHTHGDPVVFNRAAGGAVGPKPEDMCYSVSRMYFAYGLGNSVFFPLLRGAATVLTAQRADAPAALTTIERHGVSVFYAQPSFYARLLESPASAQILARLRVAVVAGEVLVPALELKLRDVLGDRLLNIFGTSEIGHAMLANGPDDVVNGTLGRALAPYRVQVVDPDGTPVPPGCEGRLEVAGPTIAPGIARGANAPARLAHDEWYDTGDAASMTADGRVHIYGRIDDIEIMGGQNVHPGEIEDLLTAHPEVREAAVCALRRPNGTSALCAFVVLADTYGSEHVSTEADARKRVRAELLERATADLTWYKVPEDVVFVTDLPRNPTGKLLRRRIRTTAGWQGFTS